MGTPCFDVQSYEWTGGDRNSPENTSVTGLLDIPEGCKPGSYLLEFKALEWTTKPTETDFFVAGGKASDNYKKIVSDGVEFEWKGDGKLRFIIPEGIEGVEIELMVLSARDNYLTKWKIVQENAPGSSSVSKDIDQRRVKMTQESTTSEYRLEWLRLHRGDYLHPKQLLTSRNIFEAFEDETIGPELPIRVLYFGIDDGNNLYTSLETLKKLGVSIEELHIVKGHDPNTHDDFTRPNEIVKEVYETEGPTTEVLGFDEWQGRGAQYQLIIDTYAVSWSTEVDRAKEFEDRRDCLFMPENYDDPKDDPIPGEFEIFQEQLTKHLEENYKNFERMTNSPRPTWRGRLRVNQRDSETALTSPPDDPEPGDGKLPTSSMLLDSREDGSENTGIMIIVYPKHFDRVAFEVDPQDREKLTKANLKHSKILSGLSGTKEESGIHDYKDLCTSFRLRRVVTTEGSEEFPDEDSDEIETSTGNQIYLDQNDQDPLVTLNHGYHTSGVPNKAPPKKAIESDEMSNTIRQFLSVKNSVCMVIHGYGKWGKTALTGRSVTRMIENKEFPDASWFVSGSHVQDNTKPRSENLTVIDDAQHSEVTDLVEMICASQGQCQKFILLLSKKQDSSEWLNELDKTLILSGFDNCNAQAVQEIVAYDNLFIAPLIKLIWEGEPPIEDTPAWTGVFDAVSRFCLNQRGTSTLIDRIEECQELPAGERIEFLTSNLKIRSTKNEPNFEDIMARLGVET